MPDGSQWVPPSERTPGDRARYTIEKMSLNPGNVSQITAALKTASPNTKRVENGARLPSRRKISQMGRDLRQAVNQRQEVFGEWSNMTNYIRGTFIPHNLDRLRDGEPGIIPAEFTLQSQENSACEFHVVALNRTKVFQSTCYNFKQDSGPVRN